MKTDLIQPTSKFSRRKVSSSSVRPYSLGLTERSNCDRGGGTLTEFRLRNCQHINRATSPPIWWTREPLKYRRRDPIRQDIIQALSLQLLRKLIPVRPAAPSSSRQASEHHVSLQKDFLQGLVLFSQLGPIGVRSPSAFVVPEIGRGRVGKGGRL